MIDTRTAIQIPKPIPFTISPLRVTAKPANANRAAPMTNMPVMKRVFEMSDTSTLPVAFCNSWKTTAVTAKTRDGSVTDNIAYLRDLDIFFRGLSIHATMQTAINRGMINIIINISYFVFHLVFIIAQPVNLGRWFKSSRCHQSLSKLPWHIVPSVIASPSAPVLTTICNRRILQIGK